jgi:osmotically-inducible protein OsmY
MRVRIVLVTFVLGLVAGCEWITTAVNTGVDVGVMLAADRSLYIVADDYALKSEITGGIFDEALLLNVSTDVYQGMVMLTGTVKEEEDKAKAERLARRVRGVREVFNEIQVTTEGGIGATIKDLLVENKLKAKLFVAPGVNSINFRWRAVNSVIYVMGMAKSREELDSVLALARVDGVRKIVTHVFLTDQQVFDISPPAPTPTVVAPLIEPKVEMEKTVEKTNADKKLVTEPQGVKKRPAAEVNTDSEKPFPRRLPPGVPPEMPTYYDRPIDQLK